jgi:DNA-binding YbaB/EbfC family protein
LATTSLVDIPDAECFTIPVLQRVTSCCAAEPGKLRSKKIGSTMPDFLGLMKQAAELKSKMEAMQAELDHMAVEGTAGGGLVVIKLSGKSELKGAQVDASLLKPDQKEILEDLLIAAHADARRKLETMLQDKMQSLTGGLPLPPGLKLF